MESNQRMSCIIYSWHDSKNVYKMNQTNENESVVKIRSPNFINEESYKIRSIIFQLGILNISFVSQIN